MSKRFSTWAWFYTAYLVGVILFGAWVRISHSGAGCGAHWPLCDGEIIPTAPSAEKIIEYTHRLTSGLCGILSIALSLWAWRLFGARSKACMAAMLTLLFVIFEGAIGAGLVLGELVADDSSVARALVIVLHLTNTLMLTGCAAATAYFGKNPQSPARLSKHRGLLFTMGGLLTVTAMTGAVTALGDTLFPVQVGADGSLLARVAAELGPSQHLLVRLRILHPLFAVASGLVLLFGFDRLRGTTAGSWAKAGLILTVSQLGIGLLNIILAAPGFMQLLHLGLAQCLWVALVMSALKAQDSF
jgi:cytochrome c oxidase assembly protein subunit 15